MLKIKCSKKKDVVNLLTLNSRLNTLSMPFIIVSYVYVAGAGQIVELSGYVVIVVQSLDGKVKLFGSPAEKDNLEVADEVLNVNERVLCDLPYAEVVHYLHEVRSDWGWGGFAAQCRF